MKTHTTQGDNWRDSTDTKMELPFFTYAHDDIAKYHHEMGTDDVRRDGKDILYTDSSIADVYDAPCWSAHLRYKKAFMERWPLA